MFAGFERKILVVLKEIVGKEEVINIQPNKVEIPPYPEGGGAE